MLPQWWGKIENNATVKCFVTYFQIWVWGRPESLNLLWGKLLWQKKWYLRKTDHFWILKRQKHWHLHMTDLFTWRKYISNFSWIKQSHLEKFSNTKLRAWILVNDGTLRNKADFASALDNVNNVKISDLLAFVAMLLFSYFCFHLKIACGGDVHF